VKRIGIVCEDHNLVSHFKEAEYFEQVQAISIKEVQNSDFDVLLISDRQVGLNELKIMDLKSLGENIFYMISHQNFTNMSQAIVKSEGVTMIPPRLTIDQIFKFVYERTRKNLLTQNKVFSFFGADSKVGTTMVAQSVCENFVGHSDRVILITLDGSSGDDFMSMDTTTGLDEIKTKLQTRILSSKELGELCIKNASGFYSLPGIKNIMLKHHYHPEQVSYLIELLEELFEIVIIDAGSNIELGMTIASLNKTPNRFLVVTQQQIVKKRYMKLYNQILEKLSIDQFMIIVNKTVNDPVLTYPVALANEYGGILISELPFLEYGWQCEYEKRTLLSFNIDAYSEGIAKISKVISIHLGMKYGQEVVKITPFQKVIRSFGRLFGKDDKDQYGATI